MLWSSLRFVVVGSLSLTLGISACDRSPEAAGHGPAEVRGSAALRPGRAAASDGSADMRADCVRRDDCPETAIDARGCCSEPPVGLTRDRSPSGCPSDMVEIAGETVVLESPPSEGESGEQKRVTLRPYCIDRVETSVAQYARCVAQGKCSPALEPKEAGPAKWCNGSRNDRLSHPINCVDWFQAVKYCEAVGKRLPSEAEWEHAARGLDGRAYPWGNDPPGPELLNACGAECGALMERSGFGASVMYKASDPWETTAPVGNFPRGASWSGALDMAGNVAEWTADDHLSYRGRASQFKDGVHRVVRGGSWTQAAASKVRAFTRDSFSETLSLPDVGFRCARDH
jgi:formylglycine-generating enzyme required for sulfatase activity